MQYKAFISYSHTADKKLAPKLQSGLQRFAKPFYRLRAMRIFRDETALHLTPELWPTIQQALKDSDNFILMASPASAGSKWVRDEVEEWLRLRNGSLDKFFIVLTEGEIVRNEKGNDFDWEKTTALPETLRGVFKKEPLHLDFRWAKTSEQLSLRNPDFLTAVGKLAAVLHNRPLDEIIGDDVQQHRRFKAVAGVTILLLLALAAATSVAAYFANESRKQAVAAVERERAAREAESREREKAETATRNEAAARGQAEERRIEAEDQRKKADEQKEVAERQTVIAEQRRAEAEAQRKEARRQQGLAEESAAEAKRRLLSLYEEQGRREALGGDQQRAMMYLSEAYSEGSRSLPLRFLLAHAARNFDGQVSAMLGHNAGVSAAHFSRDGRRVVTAGRDRTAMVWDVESGGRLSTLRPGQSILREAYISPDGRRVITIANHLDADISVMALWDADTGAKIEDLTSEMGDFGFSPDGGRFYKTLDGVPAVYDSRNGKELFKLGGQEGDILWVAFEGGGKRILSATTEEVALRGPNGEGLGSFKPGGDVKSLFFSPAGPRLVTEDGGALKLWDVEARRQLAAYAPDAGGVKVDVSQDGARVATRKGFRVTLWDAATGAVIGSADLGIKAADYLKFSADLGRLLAVKGASASVWDAAGGGLLGSFEFPGGTPSGVDLSPDGQRVFAFGGDKVGRVWEWRRAAGPTSFDLKLSEGAPVAAAAFSADGARVAASRAERHEPYAAELFDAADGTRLPLPPAVRAAGVMAVNPDARRAFSVEGGLGRLRDLGTGAITATLDRPLKEVEQAEFGPGGRLLATRGAGTSLEIWNAGSGAHVATVTYDTGDDEWFLELSGFRFSPDGSRVITMILASDEGGIMRADVWDSSTGARLTPKGIEYAGTPDDAFPTISKDNARLVTPGGDQAQETGTPVVWDISGPEPKRLKELRGHFGSVGSIAFDGTGVRLLTASSDGTAKVWEARTGSLLASLNGHGEAVTCASFDPSGEFIVTASRDKTVKVWDAGTGETLASLEGYGKEDVEFAAFSPNGSLRIVTLSGNRTVRVWDAHLEDRDPKVLAGMAARLLPYRFYNGRPLPLSQRLAETH